MSKATKPCVKCGKLMYWVESRTKVCPACKKKKQAKIREQQSALKPTAHKREIPKPQKSLAQCIREAERLNLTYGEYVRQGYDKIQSGRSER